MVLYYDENGDVTAAIVDAEAVFFDKDNYEHAGELVVDEIAENFTVVREVCRTRYQFDANGLHRFVVQDGELFERDDWSPITLGQGTP